MTSLTQVQPHVSRTDTTSCNVPPSPPYVIQGMFCLIICSSTGAAALTPAAEETGTR